MCTTPFIEHGFGALACTPVPDPASLSDIDFTLVDGTGYTIEGLGIRSPAAGNVLILNLSGGAEHPLNNLILSIGGTEFRFKNHHRSPPSYYNWNVPSLSWDSVSTVNNIQIIESITCP